MEILRMSGIRKLSASLSITTGDAGGGGSSESLLSLLFVVSIAVGGDGDGTFAGGLADSDSNLAQWEEEKGASRSQVISKIRRRIKETVELEVKDNGYWFLAPGSNLRLGGAAPLPLPLPLPPLTSDHRKGTKGIRIRFKR